MANICTSCGFENVPGTLFCEECGHGLTLAAQGRRYMTGAVSDTPRPAGAYAPEVAAVRGRAAAGVLDVDAAPVEATAPADLGAAEPARTARSAPLRAGTREPLSSGPLRASTREPLSIPHPRATGPMEDQEPAPLRTATGLPYLITESGRRVDVPMQEVIIVGREDMRSGIRPDVDLTLDGASAAGVSRRHCRILRYVDGWYLEDLMSTNFTVLNGKALAAHTPVRLQDGDDLRLGKLRLKFHVS
jgi:hypothetical protein